MLPLHHVEVEWSKPLHLGAVLALANRVKRLKRGIYVYVTFLKNSARAVRAALKAAPVRGRERRLNIYI